MPMQAAIRMNLALVLYTSGIIQRSKQGHHRKHLIISGIGLVSDYLGTSQMSLFALATAKRQNDTISPASPHWAE